MTEGMDLLGELFQKLKLSRHSNPTSIPVVRNISFTILYAIQFFKFTLLVLKVILRGSLLVLISRISHRGDAGMTYFLV